MQVIRQELPIAIIISTAFSYFVLLISYSKVNFKTEFDIE